MNGLILWLYGLFVRLLPESRCLRFKCAFLRLAGVKVGSDVVIYSSSVFHGCGTIEIGNHVFIGPRCILSCGRGALLKIGNYVNIGANSYITTGTHLIDPEGKRSCGEGFQRNVTIEDGAWLTVHVYVLPGVLTPELVIGEKSMIMAGTVISSNVEPRVMMLGNPAKRKGVIEC